MARPCWRWVPRILHARFASDSNGCGRREPPSTPAACQPDPVRVNLLGRNTFRRPGPIQKKTFTSVQQSLPSSGRSNSIPGRAGPGTKGHVGRTKRGRRHRGVLGRSRQYLQENRKPFAVLRVEGVIRSGGKGIGPGPTARVWNGESGLGGPAVAAGRPLDHEASQQGGAECSFSAARWGKRSSSTTT